MRSRNRCATPPPLVRAGLDQDLSRRQLDELAAYADVVSFGAGETLARSGQVARELLVLLDGELGIHDGTGRQRLAGRGTRVGAREVIHGCPHAATVVTRTACTFVVVFGPMYRAITASATTPDAPTRRIASRAGTVLAWARSTRRSASPRAREHFVQTPGKATL